MSEKKNEGEEVLIETDKCKIIKKEDRIVAQCDGTKEVDLGTLPAEETLDNKEECPECAAAIAVGWAVQYIKPLDPAAAMEMETELKDANGPEDIDADGIMDRCLKVADEAKREDVKNTLLDLKDLMHKPLAELEKEAEQGGSGEQSS